jgi:AhpD family alkylhydroperoxidase
MDARLDFYSNEVAGQFTKHINSAGAVITGSTLPAAVQDLVKIRASQINGCGVCLDMHTKDAGHAGESLVRINLVAAWREATVFSEAERAALELVEQGTRVADGGTVHGDAWAGQRGPAFRRRSARRTGVPHRHHQPLQSPQRDYPSARR